MNRVEFGQLVTALRREHRDENDESWTQKELGEETGLGELIIGKIERGQRTNLDEKTLLSLADALQLTSLERKEFLFAALGVDGKQIARRGSDPSAILNSLIQKMQEIQLPAYTTDVYGDVVAANTSIIDLLEVSYDYLNRSHNIPDGFNHVRIGFDPESGFRQLVGSGWHSVAIHIMQLFRGVSLRYRFTDYFSYTMSGLRKYPLFRQYWQQVYFEDYYWNCLHYNYSHPKFGLLNYLATPTQVLTPSGELYLIIYCPISPKTVQVFTQITEQVGTTVHRLASWPDKKIV